MWQRAYDAGRDHGHGRGKCILQVCGVRPFFSDQFENEQMNEVTLKMFTIFFKITKSLKVIHS